MPHRTGHASSTKATGAPALDAPVPMPRLAARRSVRCPRPGRRGTTPDTAGSGADAVGPGRLLDEGGLREQDPRTDGRGGGGHRPVATHAGGLPGGRRADARRAGDGAAAGRHRFDRHGHRDGHQGQHHPAPVDAPDPQDGLRAGPVPEQEPADGTDLLRGLLGRGS